MYIDDGTPVSVDACSSVGASSSMNRSGSLNFRTSFIEFLSSLLKKTFYAFYDEMKIKDCMQEGGYMRCRLPESALVNS
jgi:hypothetical protein